MVKITWTLLSLEDLRSIHDYIALDSIIYASKHIETLIERVDQLENFPLSGRKVPEYKDETVRELIEGNYRIVYKYLNDEVSIIRIHHDSRLLRKS